MSKRSSESISAAAATDTDMEETTQPPDASAKLGNFVVDDDEWFLEHVKGSTREPLKSTPIATLRDEEGFRSVVQSMLKIDLRVFLKSGVVQRMETPTDMELDGDSDEQFTSSERNAMPDLFVESKNDRPVQLVKAKLDAIAGNSKFAPFLAVIQSSGYGKTRAMLDLARQRRVVYLLCANINGGWDSPDVVQSFISNINKKTSTSDRKVEAEKFLDAVAALSKTYETAEQLFQSQFQDAEGKFGGFYDELGTLYNKRAQSQGTVDGRIESSTSSTSAKAAVRDTHDTRTAKEPVVVVFDEARILAAEDNRGHGQNGVHSSYRCIRHRLERFNLIGVFMDTAGQLKSFTPLGTSSDRVPDETGGIGQFFPPLFEIDSFDQFDDDEHLFFLGRPLWKMNWQTRLGKDFTQLVKFAAHKLCGSGEPENKYMALFLCRFGLTPSTEVAESLIGSHMATLLDLTTDRKHLISGYRSEPILAEAAAYATAYGEFRTGTSEMLELVSQKLLSSVLKTSKGDRGEVAAAAWMGLTLDTIRCVEHYDAVDSNLSRDVPVSDFLNRLECRDGAALIPEGEKSWAVNFTHFCRLETSPDRNILRTCWKRHAALYMIDGEEGIDILVPMKRIGKENNYSTIRIQVKNYKNWISNSALKGIMAKLDVRRCAPRATFHEEPFSIALVIQVGSGGICDHSKIVPLGRSTRSGQSIEAQQLQIGCTVSGEHQSLLSQIAGDPFENSEFVGSSFLFRSREWAGGFEQEDTGEE